MCLEAVDSLMDFIEDKEKNMDMDSLGLTGPKRFTDLSDEDLDELVRSIYSNHPHSGENLAIVIVYICKMNGLSVVIQILGDFLPFYHMK